MPERIAIKMIDNQGWILRNKIKWAKQVLLKKQNRTIGSVMPTSVKDRFNESGEELYFFVKSKKYYFDLDAVRMPAQTNKIDEFNYRVRDSVRKVGQPQFKASEEEIKRYNEIPKDYGKKKLIGIDDKKLGNRWMSGTPDFVYGNQRQQDSKKEGMHTFYSHSKRYKSGEYQRDWKAEESEGFRMGSVDSHRAALRGGLKRNSASKLKSMGVPATYIGATGEDHNLLNNPAGKNLPTIWQIGSEPHNIIFKKS